ncbi:MAG TPA: hypothetical protein VLV88_07825 [Terriglobales bacterium]|nr:hypothetical protein [Terriglobales bacterium]
MKTAKEIYSIWAPETSVWSPWVAPVIFHALEALSDAKRDITPEFGHAPIPVSPGEATAVILDLPGAESVRYAITLAAKGFCLVPLFNSSPAPEKDLVSLALIPSAPTTFPAPTEQATVSMRELLFAMLAATDVLSAKQTPAAAPPVFLLDSRRLKGDKPLQAGLFDNRWMVFPQDFPSARFLLEHGIRRVLLVQEAEASPQKDLAHVLLRWQEARLEISSFATARSGNVEAIIVPRPSWFRAVWYRALAALGLKRNPAGGYGGVFPGYSSG